MNKQTILSGIRATGRLHLGNYLGALKQYVDLQNEGKYQNFFFIADLHAITTPFEPKSLSENTLHVAAQYIAAGIDPKKSTIFLQNHVLEHTELAWIFNCLTSLGELERMTQYKDKAKEHKQNINAGLLTYPTLMAADILLYKPAMVPVGEDQTQHLELARDIAKKFNKKFGQTFPEPKNFTLKPLRIKSLKNPEKKMSKTGDEPLYMDDSPKDIEAKLKKAVTTPEGAQNLLDLLAYFGDEATHKQFVSAQKSGEIRYSDLKSELATAISDQFSDFRKRKKELLSDKAELMKIINDGDAKARKIASQTMEEVKQKIGLL